MQKPILAIAPLAPNIVLKIVFAGERVIVNNLLMRFWIKSAKDG